MRNKILIIGGYETRGADTCKWDGNLLNLTDYELVIIDTSSLNNTLSISPGHSYTTDKWPKKIEANFEYIKQKIVESILIDTQIFVLFNPESSLSYHPSPYVTRSLDTNDWFPLSMRTHIENGTTVNLINKTYREYFRRLKNWEYYYLPEKADDAKEVKEFYKPDNIRIERKIIATNKLGKPLALELVTLYAKPFGQAYAEQNSRIILLPATSEDTSEDIDILISLTKSIDQTEAPDWVNNINIPNELIIKGELDTAERKLTEKRDYYNNLIKHKRLLYDYSYSLQDICQLTLKELGANTKPSIVTDEFIIESGGKEVLVEVKGTSRSIDKDDLGQLVVDIGQHFKETGKSIKGLLIGNGWRNLPLEKREIGNARTFPKEIVKAAEDNNVGLLSSVELFNAYCAVLEGKLSKDDFLSTIFNSSGIIRFQPTTKYFAARGFLWR